MPAGLVRCLSQSSGHFRCYRLKRRPSKRRVQEVGSASVGGGRDTKPMAIARVSRNRTGCSLAM